MNVLELWEKTVGVPGRKPYAEHANSTQEDTLQTVCHPLSSPRPSINKPFHQQTSWTPVYILFWRMGSRFKIHHSNATLKHQYLKQFAVCKGPCVKAPPTLPEDEFCGWYTWVVWRPCLEHGAYGGGSYGWEVTGVGKWGGVCHMRLCLWPHVLIIRGKDSALSLLGQVTACSAWQGMSRQQWI